MTKPKNRNATAAKKQVVQPKGVGKSIAEFREAHDKGFYIPKRIKEALRLLGDAWMYEAEFVALAKMALSEFSQYRDEFMEDHCIEVAGGGGGARRAKRIWCGTRRFKTQLMERLDA